MKYAAYYWLFEPLRGEFMGNQERVPAFSTEVTINDLPCEIALLTDDSDVPEAARVILRGLEAEHLSERFAPPLQLAREHLLSTLRLAYREDIQFFPIAVWSFFEEGVALNVNMRIGANLSGALDAEKAKSFFLASLPHRHEVRLLVDGNDPRIPVQYRYLSLYKLLEHEFKVQGRWRTSELSLFLSSYEASFRKIGYQGAPARHLHELRDRCAHIRTGRSNEILGVNSLNHQATKAVSDVLPILRDICRDLLNQKTSQSFQLGDIRPWYERVEA